MNRWYGVKSSDINANGGRAILGYYNSSVADMLATVYPEKDWLPWKFARLPGSSRNQNDLTLQAIKFAEKVLSMEDPSGWKRVNIEKLIELGIDKVISANGGLANVLRRIYPNENWDSITLD